MWSSFFLENLHFALNLGAFLVFFAVFWLYFDAWTGRKTFREFLRFSGFLVLAVSFLVGSLQVESVIADISIIPRDLILVILFSTRLVGYLLLIIALQLDPLIPFAEIPMPFKAGDECMPGVPLLRNEGKNVMISA